MPESAGKTNGQQVSGINSNQRHCPKCNKAYDNSWKVCLSCGVALVGGKAFVPTRQVAIDSNDNENRTRKGGSLLVLGWVAFAITVFSLWGTIATKSGFHVVGWNERPISSFVGMISYTIGSNIFTFLALFAGLRLWKKRNNPQGKYLIYCSVALLVISFMVFLLFSVRPGGDHQTSANTISKITTSMTSLNWQRQSLGAMGVSLETPVELKEKSMQIPRAASQYIVESKMYEGYIAEDLVIVVSSAQYVNTIKPNIDSGADVGIEAMKQDIYSKGGAGFEFAKERAYVSGKDAILATAEGVLPSVSEKVKSRIIVFADASKAWTVEVRYKDSVHNEAIARRIIGSVEIE
jgi:hypothetical protein